MANENTIDVEAEVINTTPIEMTNASILVPDQKKADEFIQTCNGFGVLCTKEPAFDAQENPCIKVTLLNVDDDTLDKIQRKCRIMEWSGNVTTVARKVKNFATDTMDFALNGGVVPVVTSSFEAGAAVARVGTMAVGRTAASIINTTFMEGMTAAVQIANDPIVNESIQTVKTVGKMLGTKLFGPSGNTKFTRC